MNKPGEITGNHTDVKYLVFEEENEDLADSE